MSMIGAIIGDSDALACLAGGLAEIRFDAPKGCVKAVQKYLDTNMKKITQEFYAKLNSNKK